MFSNCKGRKHMNIEENIGNKIRNLRNQNGLTQEELADRTELTKGFISQLERGLTAPSISTLMDIVECLGTNLAEFFQEESEQPVVYPKEDYFEKTDEDGNRIEWLVASAQSRSMEPILVRIQPGQSMPVDKPHEGEEFGYVLSGSVVIHLGSRSFRAKKGESFYFTADKTHYLTSKAGALLLWVSSPPSF